MIDHYTVPMSSLIRVELDSGVQVSFLPLSCPKNNTAIDCLLYEI